ncbi:MAG TPA: SulP family inorganic anion transporter [Saprospiraceae bacterium]|nr:SulP family inorganic anion transporter [Saprospiraceae bacterium]
MPYTKRNFKFYLTSFIKYDFRSSITLFFVALPLCLGISLASGAPLYSGLLSGIIGGIVVSLLSKSQLSVSGPAAGLTAICVAAISEFGTIELFFVSIAIAGILQIMLGIFRLGGFTHFIPSAVIKGMLAAIGIILITKQVPLVLGYDQPDFWSNEFFNILTFNHLFENVEQLYRHTSAGAIVISVISFLVLVFWKKYLSQKIKFLPTSFVTVLIAVVLAWLINRYSPFLSIEKDQFVHIPDGIVSQIHLTDFAKAFQHAAIWTNALIICFVASLETLLSIVAIDKLDPYNRVTPQNQELVAQGTGNLISGLLGGLPITAVIVRSSANAEAGAKTKLSAFAHGVWLLLAILLAIPLLNLIPYAVLAVILLRTGYNLAKPQMIIAVYKQGREQFLPFIVTVIAILFTDLLIGVLIGCIYAIYFLIKHTYRAGYVMREKDVDGVKNITIDLALNVSFLNKKRFVDLLDKISENAVVEINGTDSVYIDLDILEIFHDFKSKALQKNIMLTLVNIPEVETIELH